MPIVYPNISTKKSDSVIEMVPVKDSLSRFSDVELPRLSNDQFEMLLNRLCDSSPSNPVPLALGNPGSLGLGGFALTTFMLSVFNAGSNLIDPHLESVVLPCALFYGGITQFAAGMWEFRANNSFGGTAFTSYGAFWMSFAGYVYFIVPTISSTGKTKHATGLFLLSWFIFTLYMNVAAYKTSKQLFILFTILNITFLLLIIGNLTDTLIIINIGGWTGILTAFIAWYGSAASIINITWKKSILPLGVYHT
jgi:succinate-acetate transporter protein